MQRLQYFVLCLGILLTSVSSRRINFYRSDYTYIEQYDAFYKLHWDNAGKGWEQSFLTCKDEGATLFYPNEIDEWKVLQLLMKKLETNPDTTDVFIGIHNKYNLTQFITVDGHSTPLPMGDDFQSASGADNVCMTVDVSTGAYTAKSCMRLSPAMFVCKKVDDKHCPTIDPGYVYTSSTNKCYKVNTNARRWQDAMQTCFMEGGVLTVEVNSNIILTIPSETYFIGIRDLFYNGNYYNVKGKKINKDMISFTSQPPANYPEDIYSPPNYDEYVPTPKLDPLPVKDHRCVVLYNGRLQAKSCGDEYPFICEIEANTS